MEAYLINPVNRKAGKTKRKKRTTAMAKRNKKGQFVKGGGKTTKRGGKTTKRKSTKRASRKAAPSRATRRRHVVKAYQATRHKKSATIHYKKQSWGVAKHMSNPFNMGIGGLGEELIGVGIAFGTLFAVGFLNRQSERLPLPANKWVGLGVKLGVALGAAYGVSQLSKRNIISGRNATVARVMCFAPFTMAILNEFVPAVASQVSLNADLNGYYPQELGMEAGNRLSDNTISAELAAELEQESEESAY